MEIRNFYDLEAWRVAHRLVLYIYQTTRNFPRDELFGITSQIRRATSSVTANIAEGFARYHFNDKIRFYHQARGSVGEVQNFLLLAKDLDYIPHDDFQKIGALTKQAMRLINGLIRSIQKQQ